MERTNQENTTSNIARWGPYNRSLECLHCGDDDCHTCPTCTEECCSKIAGGSTPYSRCVVCGEYTNVIGGMDGRCGDCYMKIMTAKMNRLSF